ncbi:MAG TPA: hypothetical protein VHG92_06815 [Afifellaceae bacterium]|nr:hypothetical protein [Afifellaceae bacterium]
MRKGSKDEQPISLFGGHLDALPAAIDDWLQAPEAIERTAQAIIDACIQEDGQRALQGERRRKAPESRSADASTKAFLLVSWHSEHRVPLPPKVLRALAHLLGLVSPSTSRPLAAAEMREKLFLPKGVRQVDEFLSAADRDGVAAFFGNELTVSELARQIGVSRSQLRKWRTFPLYKAWKAVTIRHLVECSPCTPEHCAVWLKETEVPGVDVARLEEFLLRESNALFARDAAEASLNKLQRRPPARFTFSESNTPRAK